MLVPTWKLISFHLIKRQLEPWLIRQQVIKADPFIYLCLLTDGAISEETRGQPLNSVYFENEYTLLWWSASRL